MFWDIIIAAGILWIVLSFFSFLQAVQIRNIYKELERFGAIAFGRDAGLFRTRVILFAAYDADGIVTKARKMRVVPVINYARVTPFPQLNGHDLGNLKIDHMLGDQPIKRAAEKLAANFIKTSNAHKS